MSNESGKPVHLTKGERRLVIEACEDAIEKWAGQALNPADAEHLRVCKLRQRQYRRLILECRRADPIARGG